MTSYRDDAQVTEATTRGDGEPGEGRQLHTALVIPPRVGTDAESRELARHVGRYGI